MSHVAVREATAGDRTAILAILEERWGGETMVVHETVYRPADHPAYLAIDNGGLVGLITYSRGADTIEVLSLDSLAPGRGIGSALLNEVERAARAAGCRRVVAVTTNDNLDALRFYQRRGFRITCVDTGAVDRARRVKPTIPQVGNHGIPLRDEIIVTKELDNAATTNATVR